MHLAIDWRGDEDDDACYCMNWLPLFLVLVVDEVKVLANTRWEIVSSSHTERITLITVDKTEHCWSL